MATYVLIHGAFQGGWAWEPVRGLLERAGHRAVAPDLPSQGEDRTPLSEITLDSYVGRVVEALDAQPEPVLLCGHSLGGLSISQAAELRPDKVRKLVYVAAFLLPDGGSPKKFYEDLGAPSPVMANCDISEDGVVTYRTAHVREQIMNTSPPEAVAAAIARLRPMARRPLARPLRLTEANYGRIPRVYVEVLQDYAIPLEYQRMMQRALPCERVITLDCDHTPMASATGALVDALLALAA